MKLNRYPLAVFVAASLILGACGAPAADTEAAASSGRLATGSSRSFEVIAVDPVRYAARNPEPSQVVNDLIRALRVEGGAVELSTETVAPLMLPRPGRLLIVNGERLTVFEYRSLSETRQAGRSATGVDQSGSGAGRNYRLGLLLAHYAGNDPAVLDLLDRVMDELIQ